MGAQYKRSNEHCHPHLELSMTMENPQPVRGPRPVRSAVVLAATVAVVVTAAVATGASPSAAPTTNPDATTSPDSTQAPDSTPSTGKNPAAIGGRPGWDGPRGFGGGFPGGFIGGPGSVTIDSIDGSKLHLKTDDGWTRTIDTSGVTITKAGKTVTAADLNAGDNVLIKEERNADGTFSVTALDVLQPHVDGTVGDVTSDTFTVKQPDGTTRTVSVDSSTTYTLGKNAATKADLKNGLQVDVEGTTTGDTFTASAVHIVPSVLAGTVTAKTAAELTITKRDGSTATITVDSSTTWSVAGVTNATIADVKVGDIVFAEGTLAADGSLAATNVVAGTKGTWEGGPGGFPVPFGPGRGRGLGGPGRFWIHIPGQLPGQNPNQPNASPGTSSDSGANG
jgi:hypothetical protein